MYVQDVALPSGSDRNKKKAEDYSSRTSTKSSDTNDRQNWCEGSTGQTANISGKSMLKTLFPNFLLYKCYLDSKFCLYLNLFFYVCFLSLFYFFGNYFFSFIAFVCISYRNILHLLNKYTAIKL